MNRSRIIWAAWNMAKALGERPTRRRINDIIKRIHGKGLNGDEIGAWLKCYQRIGQDGQPFLTVDAEDLER